MLRLTIARGSAPRRRQGTRLNDEADRTRQRVALELRAALVMVWSCAPTLVWPLTSLTSFGTQAPLSRPDRRSAWLGVALVPGEQMKRLLIGSVMLALSGGLAFAQSTSAT
jgi:hypothetical protein